MGVHVTKYETKNGKTRKVKSEKSGAAVATPDAGKNKPDGKQGA